MSVFFCADTHFLHSNIIRFCRRPWLKPNDLDASGKWISTDIEKQRTEEMTEGLITNWNSVVRPGDIVYFSGDFAFARAASGRESVQKIIKRLNGQIQLVLGNHDKKNIIQKIKGFSWVGDMKLINVDRQAIFLSHYACRVWDQSHRGSWNLVGHSHGQLKESLPDNYSGGFLLDVGVDVPEWGYTPVSFDVVRRIMRKKADKMRELGLKSFATKADVEKE